MNLRTRGRTVAAGIIVGALIPLRLQSLPLEHLKAPTSETLREHLQNTGPANGWPAGTQIGSSSAVQRLFQRRTLGSGHHSRPRKENT